MKKRNRKNTIEPIGQLSRIEDFLPPPEVLFAEDGDKVKITLSLDESTLNFFKEQSKQFGGKYQKIIREVLRLYALRYSTK